MVQLNIDVVHLICSFLTDIPDVLSLSLTSSALRPVAIAHWLRIRPVTIVGASSIQPLYNFIFADEKQRAPYIRTITIPVQPVLPNPPNVLVNRLTAVLASATRLRTLSIYVPSEPSTLFSHPALPVVISNMTTLDELDILSPISIAIELLGSTHSALKTFRHSDSYEGDEENVPSTNDLKLKLAPQLASSLQEVELSHRFLVTAFNSSMSFPGVRSATITDVNHLLRLEWLLAVFPNLDRTLIIEDCIHPQDVDEAPDSEPLREANRDAQKTRRWAVLDRVATSPLILWSLGLACPIRHLSLQMTPEAHLSQLPDRDRAHVILSKYAPVHLALVNINISLSFTSPFPVLDALFPEAAVARLTHLVLNVEYTGELRLLILDETEEDDVDPKFPWHCVMDTLLRRLTLLTHLTHVRIVFHCGGYSRLMHPPPIYDGMRSLDFGRLVSALPDAIPSLVYIFITSIRHPCSDAPPDEEEAWDVSKAWRVRRPCSMFQDPEPMDLVHSEVRNFDLEELAAEDGEAVVDREELRATEKTKWIQIAREVDEDEEAVALEA